MEAVPLRSHRLPSPSLGLISGNAMAAAHQVIVPVDGSTYGMGALMDTLGIIRMVRKNVNQRLGMVGLLLNNVNLGTVYDRTVLEIFRRRMRGAIFQTVIPSSPEADEASQLGEPVTRYAPTSWMAKAYWQLVKEVLAREPKYVNQGGRPRRSRTAIAAVAAECLSDGTSTRSGREAVSRPPMLRPSEIWKSSPMKRRCLSVDLQALVNSVGKFTKPPDAF